MHSFRYLSLGAIVVGSGVSASPIEGPTPAITPSPTLARKDLTEAIDGISFAEILLTAVPESLRKIAATNIPAVSSILWSEFLDDKKPEWFKALPTDVQSYLVHEFGPKTASASPTGESSAPTAPSASSAAIVSSASATVSLSGSSTFATSVASSQSLSQTQSKGSILSTQKAAPTASTSSSTSSNSSTTAAPGGLSHSQKVGIGVGIPFAALGAAALALGCCLLLRRRRRTRKEGSVPPSSPGFIPRFAFQEKNHSDRALHQPLHSKNDNTSYSAADMGAMNWDDDVLDDRHRYPTPSPPAPAPVIKPALFHTHSSNRARGTRTSYTSLHSVPEEREREREHDQQHMAAVPTSPTSPVSPIMKKKMPQQSRRSLIASSGPAASPPRSQVKRKPVSREIDLGSLGLSNNGSTSQSLLQRQHDGYDSGYGSNSTQEHLNKPKNNPNPFSNDYSYVEDYGAEYHHGYDASEQAWFANQQPTQTDRRVYSKTEWPLRNVRGHQRNRSPMWDRVYDG